MVLAREQKVDRAPAQTCPRAEVAGQQQQRDDRGGACSCWFSAVAYLFVHELEQLGEENPREEESQDPGIEICGEVPFVPALAEWPQQLHTHTTRKIEQYVRAGTDRADRKRGSEGQGYCSIPP